MTDKELIKYVKKRIKKREGKFLSHQENIFLHRSIFWITFMLIIFSIVTIPLIWISNAPKYLIFPILIFIISGIAVMVHSKILISNPPIDEFARDKWIWVQGRKLYFLKNLTVILSILLVGFFLIFDYEMFSKTDYFKFLPFILIAMGCELFANLIVVFIYKNPNFILNSVVTGIGSAFKTVGVLMGTTLLFGLILKNGNILLLLILVLLLPYFIKYVIWLISSYKTNQLNSIQEAVINFVNPGKFLNTLRSNLKILKDKLEANEILRKLEKKKKYGVQLALLEELTILHTNKRHWLIAFLIVLALFVLGAVAEGFFQDIINEPLKQLLNK